MKRFTETVKWIDSWFMSLTGAHKLAWLYLVDCCDCAGVWDRNDVLANCQIGSEVNWDEALKAFGDGRVCVLPNGRWLVRSFVSFQCGELSKQCAPHKAVIAKIESHGLTLTEGLFKGRLTLQEEDKEKEKEKDFGGKGSGETRTVEGLLPYATKIGLPESEVEQFFDHYESNGWKVGKNPMKSVEAALRNWKRTWKDERYGNNGKTHKPNPRNVGVVADAGSSDRIAARVKRDMQAAQSALPLGVAKQVASS